MENNKENVMNEQVDKAFLETQRIETNMNQIYLYIGTNFPLIEQLKEFESEEEKGFRDCLFEFYEEEWVESEPTESLEDFEKNLHKIYEYCRVMPVSIGFCVKHDKDDENRFYDMLEEYFLPIRQMEIINRPFVR